MRNKQYMQFSKKIVVAVTICVTVICLAAMTLCWQGGQVSYLSDIVKVYIQYAMVVFVSYSGNSALEKWIVKRGTVLTDQQISTDEEAEG